MARFGRILFLIFSLVALVALTLPVTSHAAAARSLTVLHTASTYNRIQDFKPFKQGPTGGAARRATVLKQIRAADPNTLLVSAGNDVMGTPMFAQYGGVASGEVMSRLKYDVALANQLDIMAGGNTEGFKGYQSVVNYPLVNANLDLTNLPELKVSPNTILTINGNKVGVFGMANERATSLGSFGQSASVRDTDKTIEENLTYFADKGVDIVVMISSLGVARDNEVAQKYGGKKGLDIIVGNDSSTVLGDPADLAPGTKPLSAYPIMVNAEKAPVAIVYGGNFGVYLGELDATFGDDGMLSKATGKLHWLNEKVEPDPEMQKYVDGLAAGVVMDKIIIGETTGDLWGSFQEFSWKENPLANLYADAFLEFGKPFGAQIGLVNGGAVWASIAEGKITLADLYKIQPFTNWLIIMDLKGDQLWAAIENGVSKYGENVQGSGRFVAASNLTYTYDPTKEVGHRVQDVQVNGQPIDLKATYTIATSNFMADGGDDFTMLKAGSNIFNTGISVTDLLQQYFEAHSPITPPALGRVTVVGK
jgi:5'-nucleotidase / UDP-sugar diphosphatase